MTPKYQFRSGSLLGNFNINIRHNGSMLYGKEITITVPDRHKNKYYEYLGNPEVIYRFWNTHQEFLRFVLKKALEEGNT